MNRSQISRFTTPLLGLAVVALVLTMFLQGSSPAQAQQTQQTTPQNRITVTANGAASAKPDMATLSVGVEVTAPTAKEALAAHNAKLNGVMARLRDLKIAEGDVQTSGFGLYQDYSNTGDKGSEGPAQPSGYRASSSLIVKVRDLARTGEVLDALVDAGANNASGLTFGLKDSKTLQQSAISDALNNARPKAEMVAKQLGVRLGSVIEVTTSDYGDATPNEGYGAAPAINKEMPVSTGQLTASANVTVVYSFTR